MISHGSRSLDKAGTIPYDQQFYTVDGRRYRVSLLSSVHSEFLTGLQVTGAEFLTGFNTEEGGMYHLRVICMYCLLIPACSAYRHGQALAQACRPKEKSPNP